MNIAQVTNTLRPTDRLATGAIAQHVGMLSDELALAGNEVDLYAAEGSVSAANIVEFPVEEPAVSGLKGGALMRGVVSEVVSKVVTSGYDVVHSHLWPTAERMRIWRSVSDFALVCSVLHSDPTGSMRKSLQRSRDMPFIAFSEAQASRLDLNWLGIVHHGVDTALLAPADDDIVQDKIAVIGRIKPSKGVHAAIQAGVKAGLKVEVAGPIVNERYFLKYVAPLIDSDQVKYLGIVSGEAKRRLYAESIATVVASQDAETFCLVLAESMACGTPVVGLCQSTLPEIVDSGITGELVDTHGELPEAILYAGKLARAKVRAVAVKKYGLATMAANYEALYHANGVRDPKVMALSGA